MFVLLAILALGYVYFEWSVLTSRPEMHTLPSYAQSAVQRAHNRFEEHLIQFNNEAADFVKLLSTELENNTRPEHLYTQAKTHSNFWKWVVYMNEYPILWDGFTSATPLDSSEVFQNTPRVWVTVSGNVSTLSTRIPFYIIHQTDTLRYHLEASRLLAQENILPIGKDLELTPNQWLGEPDGYPIHIHFGKFVPEQTLAQTYLYSPSGDTVAMVYALSEDFDHFKQTLDQINNRYRGLFLVSLLLLFNVLVVWLVVRTPSKLRLIVHLILIWLSWWILNIIFPLFGNVAFGLQTHLLSFINNLLALLATGFSFISYLKSLRSTPLNKVGLSIGLAGMLGVGSALAVFVFYEGIHLHLLNHSLNLFNQTLENSASATIFILVTGWALITLSAQLGWVIKWMLFEKKRFRYVTAGVFLCGMILAFVALWYFKNEDTPPWLMGVITLFLASIYTGVLVFNFTNANLPSVSLLRTFLLLNLLSTSGFFATAYFTHLQSLPEQLRSASTDFIQQSEVDIQDITTQLLTRLHHAFPANVPLSSVMLDKLVEQEMDEQWLQYSISVQLIDASGSLIGDYTTNLSAPQWSTDYRLEELIIPFTLEQIRKTNLRPVIRSRPINTLNAEYSAFRRGWIPVYEHPDSDTIKAWILVSVYKLVPEFNRPLRTVISSNIPQAGSATISLTEYENRIPIRTSTLGPPVSIPGYSTLPSAIAEQARRDSVYQNETVIRGQLLTEWYTQTANGTIVRAAIRNFPPTQYLYTFLRIYLILTAPFILILSLLAGNSRLAMLGNSRRIRDRLIDRFILASLLCLFALAGITYFIIDRQNTREVQSELLARLDNLVSGLETQDSTNLTSSDYLDNLSTIISEDAALYAGAQLVNSTTPQIYSQHILPSVLPWQVYYNILEFGSEQEIQLINLDGLEMMIGYQPLFNAQNQIEGIVAIPTFLRAPKFYQQLLSTISYLLAFFFLIFTVLMVSIGFISTRITAPLYTLREALQSISRGDLETRLPITGNDEIGLLTQAYNRMVLRLKELQTELARSEREAAWKEMARQVAHEIKNPLTPMKLNLQHLERQLQKTGAELEAKHPRILHITKSIIEQIDALNAIATDFSKFSTPIQRTFTRIPVNTLVQSVADLYQQEKGIRLVVDLCDTNMEVRGVSDELRRVLVNLIKNAIEATNHQGTIILKTRTQKARNMAEISISDDGPASLPIIRKIFLLRTFLPKPAEPGWD